MPDCDIGQAGVSISGQDGLCNTGTFVLSADTTITITGASEENSIVIANPTFPVNLAFSSVSISFAGWFSVDSGAVSVTLTGDNAISPTKEGVNPLSLTSSTLSFTAPADGTLALSGRSSSTLTNSGLTFQSGTYNASLTGASSDPLFSGTNSNVTLGSITLNLDSKGSGTAFSVQKVTLDDSTINITTTTLSLFGTAEVITKPALSLVAFYDDEDEDPDEEKFTGGSFIQAQLEDEDHQSYALTVSNSDTDVISFTFSGKTTKGFLVSVPGPDKYTISAVVDGRVGCLNHDSNSTVFEVGGGPAYFREVSFVPGPTAAPTDKPGLSTGAIVGISIAGAAGLCLIIVIVVICVRKRGRPHGDYQASATAQEAGGKTVQESLI
jgi:hypothetical protein